MVASWMLYCALVAALLGLGALAVERALSLAGRPVRWVWAASMAASVALPAVLLAAPALRKPEPVAAMVKTAAAPVEDGGIPVRIEDLPGLGTEASALPALDRPLLVGWGAASAALLATLAGLAVLLRRRRRGWTRATVDGTPVVLSRDVGPAVVGLLRSEIVLPAWVLDLDPAVRRLMVAHEEEHLRAGDPRLLVAGLALLALMPWNPALWWQLRRLRLAVEVDCDARVLRRAPDVRAYGGLLLEVGRRASGSWLPVAAFSEPVSFLERRIRVMTELRVRTPWTRAALLASLGGLLAVAACEAPHPVSPRPRSEETVMVSEMRARTPVATNDEIAAAVAEAFPEVVKDGMAQDEFLMFVAGPDGTVERTHRGRSEEFSATRLRATPGDETSVVLPRADGDRRMKATMVPSLEPGSIAEMRIVKLPAGAVAPTPVGVIWVTTKGDGAPAGERERVASPARVPVNVIAPSQERPRVRQRGTPAAPRDTSSLPAIRGAIQRHFPQYADGTRVAAEPLIFVVDHAGQVVSATESSLPRHRVIEPGNIQGVQVYKGESMPLAAGSKGVIWIRLKERSASLD